MAEVLESIKCPNCGAPLELKPGELILTCQFCASDINTATGAKYVFKHSIIPCKYATRESIEPFIRSWMTGGFLKPPDLARKSRIIETRLELIPFFVFQASGNTKYSGFITRTGTNEERKGEFAKEYSWKILARRGASFPVAEYSIPLAAKTPFSLGHVPPGAIFLNGEMEEDEAKGVLRQELDNHHRHLLSDVVDIFSNTNTTIDVKGVEFIHGPLWLIKYEYGGKVYSLVLDGATGQDVWGEIPKPEKKGLFGRKK
ncbi:MAG: hypothetical protein QCI38_06270 [Candidatus Thermoplasmatota archaeon]|nr:hypothetical protein [Candidatus Thermoplasmatota archaeon]